jgi:adenine-specific DNA glycosylase
VTREATPFTRPRPACTVCPMSEDCVAAREGRQAALPGVRQRRERGAREAVLLLAESGKEAGLAVLVERRPSSGIWGGLWSPPEFESESEALEWCRRELGELESSEALAPIDHAFTHFDLRLNPLRVRVGRAATGTGTGTATATAAAGVAAARTGAGTDAGGSWGVRESDDRLWYALEAPPKVGLPQPIHELFARMRTGARA